MKWEIESTLLPIKTYLKRTFIQKHFLFCRAREDVNVNRLYVHEVLLLKEIEIGDTSQIAAASSLSDASHTNVSPRRKSLAYMILKKLYENNPENVSKVVDKNGEPLKGERRECVNWNRCSARVFWCGWDFAVVLESECQRVSPDLEYVLYRRVCGRGKYKKRKPTSQSAFKKLVAGIGFEPMTFRLWAWRATWLLNPAIRENGAPRRIWTSNLLIRSQMLYPIELEALKTRHIIVQ